MMEECDTLLMIGTSFPYAEFLPKEGAVRAVQIDIDARRVGVRYPTEVNLIGDSRETLRALLPLLDKRDKREWRTRVEELIRESTDELREQAMEDAKPMNPQRVFWELAQRLPDNAIFAADCGTSTVWYARYLQMRRGMKATLSGTLASMGSAVPYALAAKLAYPSRPVFAILGDGAMQMIGNVALITIAKHWHEWSDPRLIVIVANNRDLNYVSWEQRALDGFPKWSTSQDLFDYPFARQAELLGLTGIRVESPDQLGAAWDAALAARRPVVFETVVSPHVPPLPPIRMEAPDKNLAAVLEEGDPDADEVRMQLQSANK
jgi:pyruvate dehydrogenase (quinone)